MTGPYREHAGTEVIEAPTREGVARLHVGPRRAVLELPDGARACVEGRALTVERPRSGDRRRRALPLDGHRLVVARGAAADGIGLWYEGRPEAVERVLGLRSPDLPHAAAVAAWRRMDRLAAALRAAVDGGGAGADHAWELGEGQHRVLLLGGPARLTLYARPLFQDRPGRVLEVRAGGTVVVRAGDADQSIQCASRFAVTVLGDRIRFESSDGADMAAVWLPWISGADRRWLAAQVGELLDCGGARTRTAS